MYKGWKGVVWRIKKQRCKWFGHGPFVLTGRLSPADHDVICLCCDQLLDAAMVLTQPRSFVCRVRGHDFVPAPGGYVMQGVRCKRCEYLSDRPASALAQGSPR